MDRIKKAIMNPRLALFYLLKYKIFRLLPDKTYLKIKYYLRMGKRLETEKPKSFNEKLQWLKLNDRNPQYIELVDKYKVREYISKVLGDEYLIPLLGVYNSFQEIDFDKLPNQFVLKPNHTSGDVFICKDKSKIDFVNLEKKIDGWLRREYFWLHREWPYKHIEPKILCEQLMVDDSGTDLKDYKFMCFNGEPKCLFVGLNRNSSEGLNVDFYDIDWNQLPFERYYPSSGTKIPKPKNLVKMVKFSEILSKDIPFVRVDFYETNNRLYFGELTFYPGSGIEEFTPESYDSLLGSWITEI